MKAMIAGFAAIVLLSVGAWMALGELGFSTEERQTSPNVRLD